MASITIRKLGEDTKRRLRVQAATHGRSMEDEVREILRAALSTEPSHVVDLVDSIQARLASLGGVELPAVPREPIREPPQFE